MTGEGKQSEDKLSTQQELRKKDKEFKTILKNYNHIPKSGVYTNQHT